MSKFIRMSDGSFFRADQIIGVQTYVRTPAYGVLRVHCLGGIGSIVYEFPSLEQASLERDRIITHLDALQDKPEQSNGYFPLLVEIEKNGIKYIALTPGNLPKNDAFYVRKT